jgi:predicted nucleic acid-binding protein
VRLEDTEDAQVLETAIASQCDLLVTANLRDFLNTDIEVIQEDRWAVYHAPNHEIYIIHPFLAAHWLNYFYS